MLSPSVAAEYPYHNNKLREQNTLFACKKSVAQCTIAESTALGCWGSSKMVWILYFFVGEKVLSLCLHTCKKATRAGK